MTLPPDVAALFDELLARLRPIFGDTLVGLYIRGSLALGDFDPATSDVDALAVIEDAVSPEQFELLRQAHAYLDTLANPYAGRLEMAYFSQEDVRRFVPNQTHVTLGQHEALKWQEHGTNWIVERWAVREQGIVVHGRGPATLIDPVTPAEIRQANVNRLREWRAWLDDPLEDDGAWSPVLGQLAYVVETMCRCRFAAATGTVASKPQAVAWALETFPDPWRSTVDRSRAWRGSTGSDPAAVPEVRAFVEWASSPLPPAGGR